MKKNEPVLSYHDYLNLDLLLSAQKLESKRSGKKAHDEMLFIITHQVYELWFKQILFEIDSVLNDFSRKKINESHIAGAVGRLGRINKIQELLIDQIKILETMTPMDFLDFRDLLTPASGFQSAQFRLIENKIGLSVDNRHSYGGKDYKSKINKDQKDIIEKSEKSSSLFDLIEQWLERTPFLDFQNFNFWEQYRNSVDNMLSKEKDIINNNESLSKDEKQNHHKQFNVTKKMFNSLFNKSSFSKRIKKGESRLSYKATHAALLIFLYRDQPILHNPYKLLSRLIDLDELLTTWRYKHYLMASRMIGRKIGTGGSVGAAYLNKATQKHRVFDDFTSLTTFLIPRSELPSLPKPVLRSLSFHYDIISDDN